MVIRPLRLVCTSALERAGSLRESVSGPVLSISYIWNRPDQQAASGSRLGRSISGGEFGPDGS